MKRITLAALFVLSLLAGVLLSSCASSGPRVAPFESMAQLEFDAIKADATLAVTAAVGIALDSGAITEDDQLEIATRLEQLAAGTLEISQTGPLVDLLEDAGVSEQHVRTAFMLAESILRRAGVDFSLPMTPRLADFLRAMAEAVVNVQAQPAKAES